MDDKCSKNGFQFNLCNSAADLWGEESPKDGFKKYPIRRIQQGGKWRPVVFCPFCGVKVIGNV